MQTAGHSDNQNRQDAEAQRIQNLIKGLCQLYGLNASHVTTYLGHLTNNAPHLIQQIVSSHTVVVVEQAERVDPRQKQQEFIYCLLSGKATLLRMQTESDGREVCMNRSAAKQRSSLMSLYNYRTHQSNQFFLLDCAAQTKLLRLTVPDNLTFKTYAKNAHKLSYLSEFFVRKYATSKNTLHAYIGLFSHSSYVKGTALTRFHCHLGKISILVEGGCSYSKSVRGGGDKGKQVLLFTRGPRSIVGAQLLKQDHEQQQHKIAEYTVCIDSAAADFYEIRVQDIHRLPNSMLIAFTETCRAENRLLEKLSAKTISREQINLADMERQANDNRQAIHSNVQLRSSPILKKQEFDDKLYEMMCSRVKDDRTSQLERKIAFNLNEITRARSSFERVTDFKQLLDSKINQKEELQKQAVVEADAIEQLFEDQLVNVFQSRPEEKEDLITKTEIKRYNSLLSTKNKIIEQKMEDKAPLMLLKEESRVDSKSFKLKMLRRGFLREDYEAYLQETRNTKSKTQYNPNANNFLTRVPIEQKFGRIKQQFIKKINLTNRIKEQCVMIRSGFTRQEPVQLEVLKGYQSMKQMQFHNVLNNSRKDSLSSQKNEGSDYGMLLRMLQRTQRREQSLQRVHQKVSFLNKRTLTPYNHSSHLKESARLHRYSVSSMRKHRRDSA